MPTPNQLRATDLTLTVNKDIADGLVTWKGHVQRFLDSGNVKDAVTKVITFDKVRAQAFLDQWQKDYPGTPAKFFLWLPVAASFFDTLLPGSTKSTTDQIPIHTINPDGSVTLT